jgi:hypothetical protein
MKGCLVITLDPPYIGFAEGGTLRTTHKLFLSRSSSPEEIGDVLRFHGVSLGQHWPIEDYVACIPCILSDEDLARMHLLNR